MIYSKVNVVVKMGKTEQCAKKKNELRLGGGGGTMEQAFFKLVTFFFKKTREKVCNSLEFEEQELF